MRRLLKNFSVERMAMVLFISGLIMFFGVFYRHHLWQREQVQLLELTLRHIKESLSVNGGFSVFAGEFITQFFHIPVLGALLVTALLVLLQQSVKRLIVSLFGQRQLILLSWLPSLIYAILLTDQYYYVAGLAGLVIAVTGSAWYVRKVLNDPPLKRISRGLILLAAVYWLAGGAFLSCALVMIVSEVIRGYENRGALPAGASLAACLAYLLLSVVLPLIVRTFILKDTVLQAYLSEAYHAVRIFFPLPLVLVFASVPVLLVLFHFLPPVVNDSRDKREGMMVLFALAVLAAAGLISFADFSEEREMAYENYVYYEKWDRVISLAESHPPESGVQRAALNLALGMTGRLLSDMFHFRQDTSALFVPYVRRGMTPFIAGDVLYHLGLVNFAQMFAMETIESTVDARLPSRAVRRVAETYLLNGQTEIASKFYKLLNHTLFYRREAEGFQGLADDTLKISSDRRLARLRSLIPGRDFFYDQNRPDYALTSLALSNPSNRMAFEYLMAECMLRKDLDGFLRNIGLMDRFGYDHVPVPYQEAVAYILTRIENPQEGLRSLVTDASVIDRLKEYASAYNTAGTDTLKMEREFGDTYWFYLHYR